MAVQEDHFRMVPIPTEEHGYSNFDSIVIRTPDEMGLFLGKSLDQNGMGWNDRMGFENILKAADVDFDKEVLVLLRHTEGSVSTEIQFKNPLISKKRLILGIARKVNKGGSLGAVAYYCFALIVSKESISEVEWQLPGQNPERFDIGND